MNPPIKHQGKIQIMKPHEAGYARREGESVVDHWLIELRSYHEGIVSDISNKHHLQPAYTQQLVAKKSYAVRKDELARKLSPKTAAGLIKQSIEKDLARNARIGMTMKSAKCRHKFLPSRRTRRVGVPRHRVKATSKTIAGFANIN